MIAIDPYLNDWLDFLFRWLHVIAGIVWIGSSFYFIALDNHLTEPKDERDAAEGVGGEAWEIHGGGFYVVRKYRVAPPVLPERLHWFKWEAYTTWLSGFALLIVVYYVNADTYLVDKTVADISTTTAIAASVALLAVAWLVYDGLCRLLAQRPVVLAATFVALLTAAAYGISELFGGRALWIQVGAMLGTIMVANVFFVIIPAHRELVRAKEAGREPDPAAGVRGKQRSVHNNYLTLPVVLTMISNHFPVQYSRSNSWLVLVALMATGAWVRHFFNLRHQGKTAWPIPVTAALAVTGIALAIRPDDGSAPAVGGTAVVPFAQVRQIVQRRCVECHSANPTNPDFSVAPKGIELDSPEKIARQADAIEEQAVTTKAMPLGNVTGMTQRERDLLGRWIDQGANIR
jgi:uncharacterized membrane protein